MPGSLDAPKRVWYPSKLKPNARTQKATRIVMEPSAPQGNEWEQLFSVAPCGLILLDAHAVVQYLNPSAAQLLGLDLKRSVGQPLTDLLPTWKGTPFYASLPSFLGAQSTFEAIQFDVPGPDAKALRLSAAYVPNGAAKARGVLLTVIENTEVATLERRLHRAEYQASIGKLARGIAHELNSPLDGVLRYTHLALEHLTEDSPVREYLIHVKEGLDRMVRAVRAFLEFSRQVTTPVNRVANLNQLVEDALLLVQHRAKFQQVRIVKQFDAQLPAVLDGGLQHAVVNLVKNAFDAMPRGGTLTITTRTAGSQVVVDVEDTGSGIPEEIRPRIFEPFFSTKPIHQGSGLGLIIAKEVVERSGGTIGFTSQAGAGTTFRIQVPLAPSEAAPNGA
ncbi:MAG: PAS domain-containing protein [Candidatus Omnitrophica bacterium]|nr:PAS domain-containing protein [Candidatus Omnitrophota bacterium]